MCIRDRNQYLTEKKIKSIFGEDVASAVSDISRVRFEEKNIKSVIDQNITIAKAKAERITEDAKKFREKQQEVFGEVCRALGMNVVSSNAWSIAQRAKELVDMANENHVIRQASMGIDNAIATLERYKKSLPEAKKDDAA